MSDTDDVPYNECLIYVIRPLSVIRAYAANAPRCSAGTPLMSSRSISCLKICNPALQKKEKGGRETRRIKKCMLEDQGSDYSFIPFLFGQILGGKGLK